MFFFKEIKSFIYQIIPVSFLPANLLDFTNVIVDEPSEELVEGVVLVRDYEDGGGGGPL